MKGNIECNAMVKTTWLYDAYQENCSILITQSKSMLSHMDVYHTDNIIHIVIFLCDIISSQF